MRENILCAPIECWVFFRVIPKIAPNGTCDLFLMYVLILSLYLALAYNNTKHFQTSAPATLNDYERNTHTCTQSPVFQGKPKWKKKLYFSLQTLHLFITVNCVTWTHRTCRTFVYRSNHYLRSVKDVVYSFEEENKWTDECFKVKTHSTDRTKTNFESISAYL